MIQLINFLLEFALKSSRTTVLTLFVENEANLEGTDATFEVKDLDFPLLNTIDINTPFCFFLKKGCYGDNKNFCAIDIINRLSGCYREIMIW